MKSTPTRLSRRRFLQAGAAAGGGLLIGIMLPPLAGRALAGGPAAFQPNAFIRIAPDNTVTIIVGQSEMGQGVLTSLPQLIADELDADWALVRVEQGPASADFARPGRDVQSTGGSSSVRLFMRPLREAGAAGRQMLLAAAAQTWNVEASTCRSERSHILHPSGKRASYGELSATAATLPVPSAVTLKTRDRFTLIGKEVARTDGERKVTGAGKFGMDVQLPGMLTAVVAFPPVVGGKVASFDGVKALRVRGVARIVRTSFGVAVLADNFWSAKQGRDALKVKWHDGANARMSTDTLRAAMRELLQAPGRVARSDGDVGAAKPAKAIEALYDTPYLAHATMEPQNCTAWVKRDSVELWVGTQAQTYAQRVAAQVAGLRPDQVKVNTMLLGGGFGRRSAPDFVPLAVEIAKAAGVPVKLVYTREDDMRGCYYRPMALTRLTGGIDADGNPIVFTARCASSSLSRASGNTAIAQSGYDRSAVEGLANWPYATANVLVDWQPFEPGVPVWFWRSVGSSHNTFISESFVDELAHLAGKDPYEYRRALLAKRPRHRRVLELAATSAGWGSPPPAGRARGIAVAEAFGSFCAQVAEVSMGTDGAPHVHKVVCAIDCGAYVNPNIIRAQMEGGIVYGLSQVLYGQITFRNGRVEQSNFHDYKVVRMPEAPAVEVHLVENDELPGGIGEPGVPPLAPAVCNAIFALTGKRIRKLPLDFDQLKSA